MGACEGRRAFARVVDMSVEGAAKQPLNRPPQIPHATLLPYLPMSAAVEFAGWWLGPLESYEGRWHSKELERATRRLAAVFRDTAGAALRRPSMLVRSVDGVDGVPPTNAELKALQLAISFATIHQNRYWTSDTQSDSWRVATADNATVWVQPLDLVNGYVALGRGARVQTLAGGHQLNDESFAISPPLELHMPFGVSVDAELLEALYSVQMQPPDECEHLVASLCVAIRWLVKSWQNTPSITWEDRLVFAKVATEALTGEDQTQLSAQALMAIFASARRQEGAEIGASNLLWQPDEPTLTRHWVDRSGRPKAADVTQFEHWAGAFGDERNAIVHGEASHNFTYDVPGSPYNGPFVEVADRVVREAIVVQLGNCGFPDVWRTGLSRASMAAYRHLRDASHAEANADASGAPT